LTSCQILPGALWATTRDNNVKKKTEGNSFSRCGAAVVQILVLCLSLYAPAGERQVKQSKIIGGGSWLDEKSAKSQGQIGPQVDTAV